MLVLISELLCTVVEVFVELAALASVLIPVGVTVAVPVTLSSGVDIDIEDRRLSVPLQRVFATRCTRSRASRSSSSVYSSKGSRFDLIVPENKTGS